MKLLSIGEMARRTGVRASALRYYEKEGILPAATRVSGRRFYDTDMLRMIAVLRFARCAGFTLSEIKVLFNGFEKGRTPGERWRVLAEAKLAELDQLVANAARMRAAIEAGMQCSCVRLEDCILPDVRRAPEHVSPVPRPFRTAGS